MAKSDSHASEFGVKKRTRVNFTKVKNITSEKTINKKKRSGLAVYRRPSLSFLFLGLSSRLAVCLLILLVRQTTWPGSGVAGVNALGLARKGVGAAAAQLQGYDDQMMQNQLNLEKKIIAQQELENLANENFDFQQSAASFATNVDSQPRLSKRTPRYDFSAKTASQEDLKFIEEVSAECMFNPQLCQVLASIVNAELDYMKSAKDDQAIFGLEEILSREERSPEGDMKRMLAQTRQLRDKQYMRRFGKNGNNRYGMRFRRM